MTTGDASPWLTRSGSSGGVDDAGAVLRAWRTSNRQNQTVVASLLGITQQNLSQIENGSRPISLELRRKLVELLGIAPEDLGLSSGQARSLIASDDASPEIASSRFQWRNQRRWLNQHRSDLAQLAVKLYPAEYRVPRTPLIAHPDWVTSGLLELSTLNLTLSEQPHSAAVDGSEPETEAVRPLRVGTTHFERYTSVIKHLDPPTLFESRPSYRLLGGELATSTFEFGLAAYFDKLDVSEALGHELARACMDNRIPADPAQLRGQLPFRDLIGDPFDPTRRAIIPAITTLTIRLRRYPAEPSFLLHWRDPAKVATAGGVYDVIPAGEFQPSSVALWDRSNDFDMWRNIVREYSEELLGEPEFDGTRTQPIDYDNWSLYRELTQARREGTVGAFFLGIGMDALTLAATMLTVVVIDDDVFEKVFGDAVRYNDEGEIVSVGGGTPTEGIPFTAESVDRMLSSEPMASPGAACLALAWKHRDQLLGF
ncbi:helix-turn-helix transcriptional regulator [Lentzea sp. PSKA42]|uniref:Helix-turn-helix transcriptional regulator n=1 Tax=Lentzea indica TaxID=2604800 RepID=A0ABX1FLQ3_9PSEU|nr:helix-turn-helix transcriptional regulator [Lentzea indica]NKE59704.1 helix-turn-helix transcriptional regulator [Lentzea indica]